MIMTSAGLRASGKAACVRMFFFLLVALPAIGATEMEWRERHGESPSDGRRSVAPQIEHDTRQLGAGEPSPSRRYPRSAPALYRSTWAPVIMGCNAVSPPGLPRSGSRE